MFLLLKKPLLHTFCHLRALSPSIPRRSYLYLFFWLVWTVSGTLLGWFLCKDCPSNLSVPLHLYCPSKLGYSKTFKTLVILVCLISWFRFILWSIAEWDHRLISLLRSVLCHFSELIIIFTLIFMIMQLSYK